MVQVNLPSSPIQRRGAVQETAPARPATRSRTERPEPPRPGFLRRFVTGLFQFVFAVALLAGGYYGYEKILAGAPKAERKPPQRIARLVEVTEVGPADTGPVIEAWGQVVAAETLVVRSEISGTLEWVHEDVTPGGRLTAGQVVARFDEDDLKLAVAQAENAVAQIDARIMIEKGQGDIGKRTLTRLTSDLTDEQKALVLRQPQMASLLAERAAAIAVRDQARNVLARATVRAPFNALVVAENVAPGSVITQGTEAATLVDSDRFHVTLAVPSSALQWLRFDGTQTVTLTQPGIWPEGQGREGRILRLNSALTEKGRMAEVIVEIPDPLALAAANAGRPKVLLGSFVRGTIAGDAVADAVRLDRRHLRDGDTVWIMDGEDRLAIRPVTVIWRGPDHVLVTDGLAPGDRVVTTTLATYAPGMALRIREEDGKPAVTAAKENGE